MSFHVGTSGTHSHGPGHTLRSFGKTHELKPFNLDTTRKLLVFLRPHRGRIVLATVLMLISSALTLLTPYLIKIVIDVYIVTDNLQGLDRFALITACAFVALSLSRAGQQYILSWVGHRVLYSIRAQLFRHLQRIHLGYHDTHIVGVTLSKIINDVEIINSFLSDGLVNLIGDAFVVLGIIAVMILMSPTLALVTLTILPLMIVSTILFTRHAKTAYGKTRSSIAALVGDLAENLAGMRIIQAFAQEESAQNKFEAVNRNNWSAHISATSIAFVFLPTVEFIGIAATVIVLWFGGFSVASGAITIGTVVAFLSYVTRFFQPIQEISQIYTTMQAAMAGGEKVMDLLETPPEVVDAPGAKTLSEVRGKIEFRRVLFEYRENLPVLENINMTIEPGQTVALVGRTGAGKTTVCNLMARFYEVSGGSILIDDQDIRTVTQESLHRHMGLVPQDPFLFSGTIIDNIQFGRRHTGLEEIIRAAKTAKAHEFIRELPEGYDTMIQEEGVNLSSGQRQLICIARAILADPRIIILDEATASVDTLTELLIREALAHLFRGRTAVVIAHRLTTIQNADVIYVMEQGRIVEAGTHEGLLSEGRIYGELYKRQFIAEDDTE
jgi:ABC-type multidrug transport system fused ATPase/permease subunit